MTPDPTGQQATLDFGRKVERLESHVAFLFLIENRAYKMKRAVHYSFLDFSSLEKRRRVIEAELRLNRVRRQTSAAGSCL